MSTVVPSRAGPPPGGLDPPPADPDGEHGKSLSYFLPRGMTMDQLVEERVCYEPAHPCRGCVHLGAAVAVPDGRGARRVRRRCAYHRHGHTASDWPSCPHYTRKPDEGRP